MYNVHLQEEELSKVTHRIKNEFKLKKLIEFNRSCLKQIMLVCNNI